MLMPIRSENWRSKSRPNRLKADDPDIPSNHRAVRLVLALMSIVRATVMA